jgi:hypothetical protein
VAAVAMAGRARSVSARSSGTRMELNIGASLSGCRNAALRIGFEARPVSGESLEEEVGR